MLSRKVDRSDVSIAEDDTGLFKCRAAERAAALLALVVIAVP